MRLQKILFGATGAFVLFQASSAIAQEQPWLRDRRYQEGIGYRAGNLEIHPGLAGEFGYDSNFYYRAKSEKPVDALRLMITPSLSLATLGPQRRGVVGEEQEPPKVNFRAGLAASYNEYIGVGSKPAGDTNDPSDYRNVGGNGNFVLDILPQRRWGASVYGALIRTIQPSNLSETKMAFNRIAANAGGDLIWAPGGGIFEWRLGYRFDTTQFEKEAFRSMSNNTHYISTRGRWKFYPKSSVLFDASQGFLRYPNANASTVMLNSDPLRARLGVNTLLTGHLAFVGMVGWGASFTRAGATPAENYDGPIGQAQFTFYPTPSPDLTDAPRETSLMLSQIGLGFNRDFANSYLGSFYTRDRGYLTASFFFAGRVLVTLDGGVSRVHFPTLWAANAGGGATIRHDPFNDFRIDSSLFAEYRVLDSLGINATFRYDQNKSVTLGTDDLSWNKIQAYAGVRWLM